MLPGRSGSPPIGLNIDRRGVHFDSATPSDLERLLVTDPLDDAALLTRARDAAELLNRSHLSKYNAFVIATTPLFFISIPSFIILIFTDWSNLLESTTTQIYHSFGAVTILAVIGTAISLILFNRLVQIAGPVFASSVTYFIPFVALFIGLNFGETITGIQMAGMGLILMGLYLINRKKSIPVGR